MAIAAGTRLGPYEVFAPIGSGGMGEVYQAHDTKLGRDVAIKVLPEAFAHDTERLTRFQREAKMLALLNHPNIATIYGLEQFDGVHYLVMELVPGETLAERISKGTLPVEEALKVARQVAEALEAAHEKGVMHRDLKPANVKVTPEGRVKVLDFGLAKAFVGDSGLDLSNATTLTGMATEDGRILGTPAYMSPEQARGKPVDKRADIWAFGCVLYELLTARRAFRGETLPDTLAAVLEREPDWESVPPATPSKIRDLLRRCLQKDPQRRLRDFGDARIEIEEAQTALATVVPRMKRDTDSGRDRLSEPAPFEKGAPPAASVVVLPFVNLSAEAESEYFSDGLTEELIHALSSLANLHVVSRTSAFEFKGKPQSVRKIGEQLNVSTVLEGSVRKVGQKLRVSAQLVSVANGYCVWSQRFDRETKEVFEIQDEIARTIVDMLKVRLNQRSDLTLIKRPSNLEAYDLYLRGRFQWNKRGGEGFRRALEYFQLALTRDPGYAPAYSGIADFHIAVASWGLETPAEAWPKAKAAAMRALEIDDTLAEAHASMGTIRMWYEWNWKEAEREFLRAIELNPGHPNARVQYNLLLVQTGRFDEAEREVRAALLADPLSIPINTYLAGIFHYRRQYDRSLEQCRQALELDPNDIELHVVLALNYEQKGMYNQAIHELEKASELSGNNRLILGPLGSCYGALGQKAQAMKLIEELDQASQRGYVAPITRVMIYLGLREQDLAFHWLEKAADARDVLVCYLGVGPIYDCIRGDRRYEELRRRMGLAPSAESQDLTA